MINPLPPGPEEPTKRPPEPENKPLPEATSSQSPINLDNVDFAPLYRAGNEYLEACREMARPSILFEEWAERRQQEQTCYKSLEEAVAAAGLTANTGQPYNPSFFKNNDRKKAKLAWILLRIVYFRKKDIEPLAADSMASMLRSGLEPWGLADALEAFEQEKGKPTITPEPKFGTCLEGFFFHEDTPFKFALLQWRLLNALWDKGSVSIEDIADKVYEGDDRFEGKLRKLVSDTNSNLLKFKLPYEIMSSMSGFYTLQRILPSA